MTITADTPLDLFSEAMQIARRNTRTTHPDTSLSAAGSTDVPGSELAVLRVLDATRAPIADHEIHKSIATSPAELANGKTYSPSRVRTARVNLERAGYVEEVVGNKILTPDGGPTRTWRITLAGRLHLMDNA